MRFRKHRRPELGIRCEADIVFVTKRVAVFVDGCFWHRCPIHGTLPAIHGDWWRSKLERNVERDQQNDALLINSGWRIVRVWEHESPADVVTKVIEAFKTQVD